MDDRVEPAEVFHFGVAHILPDMGNSCDFPAGAERAAPVEVAIQPGDLCPAFSSIGTMTVPI